MQPDMITIDGNEAAARVAHALNEVIAIYPITPSSPMGELSDQWSSEGRPNIWGAVPAVVEMQSEGGVAGAVHGALQAGALATTFTSSQGLLLMIPNLYKIAGELTPAVFHVAARTVATASLSIFGDHSDVMAARATGFALLASSSVQEAQDLAAVAHAASLEGRVPVLHFFDGFRTSHELMKIEALPEAALRALIDEELVRAHRARALSPDHPVLRGTAMNPDVAFQAREAVNPFYLRFPEVVLSTMERFAGLTGRRYGLFDYEGAPDAERVLVIMGSGAETAGETVEQLVAEGEKVGLVKVRLFRPFSVPRFLQALPPTVRAVAVLDRTKEPGAPGEPLYQDAVTAFAEAREDGSLALPVPPRVIGGRYGLSSKEFTPAMVKAVLDELRRLRPRNHFTVGIRDDLTGSSLEHDPSFLPSAPGVFQAVFYGLGSDGTVSATKNSIKIIGDITGHHAQGYFVYDSKKAGSLTVSHLRFGPRPIRSTYLVQRADLVACHQFHFLERYPVLERVVEGGIFLLNSPHAPDEVWDRLPRAVQEQVIRKRLRFHVVDAYRIAREAGLAGRINTIMQTCFFQVAGVMDPARAVEEIKRALEASYGRRGEEVVRRNFQAVDRTREALHEVPVPATATGTRELPPPVSPRAPREVQELHAELIAGRGDQLPVSRIPCDGTFPTGTARWEKRNLAEEIPVWDPATCTQCAKCTIVCPHTAIRLKVYPEELTAGHPPTFKWTPVRGKELGEGAFTIQVAPEDCTGCGICVHVCPARKKTEAGKKALDLQPQPALREEESRNWEFFLEIPEMDRGRVKADSLRGSQLLEPLFDASGACAGCGETPYLRLLTQLFGDRLLVANATGCSSIYGGNLPTTPWSKDRHGRGPAWSNSLFEDNAEFGLGFRLTLDQNREYASALLRRLRERVGPELAEAILSAPQEDEADIHLQRARVKELRDRLADARDADALDLLSVADSLVKKSVWIVGGDGWAYDIGFGGLDHVLASGHDVNVLVLDTEVYSNTGGQMSKSTPRAAVAKFAAHGKRTAKKDLALMALTYGNVYVARVALGANENQTVHAFVEAERHPGPSLIIAYSHCIAHGFDLRTATDNQKAAVQCGHWPLFRHDPARAARGQNPLGLDSQAPRLPFEAYARLEARYGILARSHPEEARRLMEAAQRDVEARWKLYSRLAALPANGDGPTSPERAPPAPPAARPAATGV